MRPTILVATALFLAAGAAGAADAPQRKSGLWEITNTMGGSHPMSNTMQQCVDAKTDKLTEQGGQHGAEKQCSKNDIKRDGNKVVSDSVCKVDKTTVTTHAEFSGDFGSNYRGDIKSAYNPPMNGMKDMQMTLTAKWLGPCKPGQKPGDIVMPGGMKFNPQDYQKRTK